MNKGEPVLSFCIYTSLIDGAPCAGERFTQIGLCQFVVLHPSICVVVWMKKMPHSCVMVSSMQLDGDLPSLGTHWKVSSGVQLWRINPPQLMSVLLCHDGMQRDACMGKGKNQEMSAKQSNIEEILKDRRVHKGCQTFWTFWGPILYVNACLFLF